MIVTSRIRLSGLAEGGARLLRTRETINPADLKPLNPQKARAT